MNATRSRSKAEDTAPQPPQTSPTITPLAGGHSDFNGFIWQQLNDIQKCLGTIQESQRNLSAAQEKLDDKVSGKLKKIDDDLAEIKQIRHTAKWLLIVAGTVGGLLLTGVGLVFKEVWSVAKPVVLEKIQSPPVAPATVVPPQPTPRKQPAPPPQ
jgi:hypothetical protein